MTVNVFDQASRFAVQSDPIGFFRWLAPGLDMSLRFEGWLDTRTLPFPGDPDRVCDTVAHLRGNDASSTGWAVVTEFQAEPEPEMLDRLLEYLARLRRGLRHGPQRRDRFQVVAALVGLTGPPQPGTLEMSLPGLSVPSLSFRVVVKTLRDEDAASTLLDIAEGRTSRGVLSWVSLMRGGGEPGIIEHWKQVGDGEPDLATKAAYGTIALTFAELVGRESTWRVGLEGWNMRESTIANEWKAEGKIEAERDTLLRLARLKSRSPLPEDFTTAVERQRDLEILARWIDQAALATTLDELLEAIRPL